MSTAFERVMERIWWNEWIQVWGAIGMAELTQYCGPFIPVTVH
jgi:hypothetical protein